MKIRRAKVKALTPDLLARGHGALRSELPPAGDQSPGSARRASPARRCARCGAPRNVGAGASDGRCARGREHRTFCCVSPHAYLCRCGALHDRRGLCARCRRAAEAKRPITPQRRARSSARYQRVRAEAKRRDGYRCQRCGSSQQLEAHHIVALADGGDPYALSNLVTLCARCHRGGGVATGDDRHTRVSSLSRNSNA